MKYRKIKKAFLKKFGYIVLIKLYRKSDHKYMVKASKKLTARNMRWQLFQIRQQ